MRRIYKLVISLIALVAVSACMFLMTSTYTSVFWVNYIFSMVAIILATGVIVYVAALEKKVFGISLIAYSWVYLVVELSTAFRFVFIPSILVRKVCLVHVVILAVYLVVIILGKAENEFIGEQQEIRGRELMNFKYTLECMKNAQSKVEYSASYRKTVEHAYDSLASGQTASTPEVEDVERSILSAIEELDKAISGKAEEEILQACSKIEKLAAERKAKLACKANF